MSYNSFKTSDLTSLNKNFKNMNPIVFVNALSQKTKSKSPNYTFITNEKNEFRCKMEYNGKTFKGKDYRQNKRIAKHYAARKAVKYLIDNLPAKLVKEITQTTFSAAQLPKKKREVGESEVLPSIRWYQKILKQFPQKRPVVLLLEFCQYHKLGFPVYHENHDEKGRYKFDLRVGSREFKPNRSFLHMPKSKDHVAEKGFIALFSDFCDKEQRELNVRKAQNGKYRLHSNYSRPTLCPSQDALGSTHVSSVIGSLSASALIECHLQKQNQDQQTSISKYWTVLNAGSEEVVDMEIDEVDDVYYLRVLLEAEPKQEDFHDLILKIVRSHGYHPYLPPPPCNSEPMQIRKKSVIYKKYVSLLHEICQAKKWVKPIYNIEEVEGGFKCNVQGKDFNFMSNNICYTKSNAMEEAAKMAYQYFVKEQERNIRVQKHKEKTKKRTFFNNRNLYPGVWSKPSRGFQCY
ncbi:hypothetical protein RclHR1_09340008 [Rhizophagus clarus]|uniref:DRBM domain-containing protein n=1 Tax=Rhizophagus clarus TaxID=94130 RepID=A0A2Z6SQJ3_9GLOM|nr:hypothetical protein RclHR1_09340008 [Rhizophagus clarus]GES82241.1 hypothetical protein GLOIN_2v1641573 [Rhizophagus clarus]